MDVKFDFKFNYILENNLIRIVPFEIKHIQQLNRHIKDEELWRYFLEKGNGDTEFNKYCQKAISNRHKEIEYPFSIFNKETDEYIGMTRLYDLNIDLKVIKIGHSWLARQYWGQRLNTNVKYLLFNFIFETLDIHRIGFGVHSENKRSIGALSKIGCTEEGRLREFLSSIERKARVDLIHFSILRHEWDAHVKSNIENKLL